MKRKVSSEKVMESYFLLSSENVLDLMIHPQSHLVLAAEEDSVHGFDLK